MKNIKSLGIIAVIFVLAAFFSNFAVLAEYVPQPGDIIKVGTNPALYLMAADGSRQLFSNAATFWTRYDGSWSNIKSGGQILNIKNITQDDFDKIPAGKNVVAKEGVNLVKFDNSGIVYAVSPGGLLHQVGNSADDSVAKKMYGIGYKDSIITIQSAFQSDYSVGDKLDANSSFPDGATVKDGDSYFFYSGGQKLLSSLADLIARGVKVSSIIAINGASKDLSDNTQVPASSPTNFGLIDQPSFNYFNHICKSLTDSREFTSCSNEAIFFNVYYKNNLNSCKSLTKSLDRDLCYYYYSRFVSRDNSQCSKINDADSKEICYFEEAKTINDCDKNISGKVTFKMPNNDGSSFTEGVFNNKDYCYVNIAIRNSDSSICGKLSDSYAINTCYARLSYLLSTDLCSSAIDKNGCESLYNATKQRSNPTSIKELSKDDLANCETDESAKSDPRAKWNCYLFKLSEIIRSRAAFPDLKEHRDLFEQAQFTTQRVLPIGMSIFY